MPLTESEKPNVVVAGGGPGGLLAAILLASKNIPTTVVERSSKPDQWSTRSYSIVLGERGTAALEKAGCLEAARDAGMDRRSVIFFDGRSGEQRVIPKKAPGIGFSRPLLVQCLEEVASKQDSVTIQRGAGVSKVVPNASSTGAADALEVVIDDGSTLLASHVIGADGKWSKVRQSVPELESQANVRSEPSFGVHMMMPSVPDGWRKDGTYVVKPQDEEGLFYIIASFIPTGEMSVSMVCYDETVEKYPWLAPPDDLRADSYGQGGWEDEYSARPQGSGSADGDLLERLAELLEEKVPAFFSVMDREAFSSSVRINRRVTWLEMSANEGGAVSYATENGRIALIGDAAHAVTPTLGEGCNMALESAVRLVGSIVPPGEGEETPSVDALSAAFVEYGQTRPREAQPIQVSSAARSKLQKQGKR